MGRKAQLTRPTVVNLREAEFDVYIGRAGNGFGGYYGNPFVIGKPVPANLLQFGSDTGFIRTRTESIAAFRRYLAHRVATDPAYAKRLHQLAGKRLGCFCAPHPCHGDVIADWVEAQIAAGVLR